MIAFVQSNQVVNINGLDFAFPTNTNGEPVQIPCAQTEIIASYWRVPQTQGGRVTGYQYIVAGDSATKPQPDALKVLEIKLTNDAGVTSMMVGIVDADNVSTTSPPNRLAYLCDGSGGNLPVMPTVTIPIPIQQNGPQSTDSTTSANTFIFPFPANPAGLLYNVLGSWFNGLLPTPAYAPSGITTVAGVVTWANANWNEYGTWSNPSTDILKLVSLTSSTQYVLKAGIVVELEPTPFCFDLSAYSTPEPVNQIKFGTGGLISVDAFLLTNDPVVAMNVLLPKMAPNTVFDATSVSHKLTVTTVQATPKFYNDGVLVVASTAGACS